MRLRLLQIEDYAREHLDVTPLVVMGLIGCSHHAAERMLRLLTRCGDLKRTGRDTFAFSNKQQRKAEVNP